MIKETSLLYYPNPQTGFEYTLTLSDGSSYTIYEFGKTVTFTVSQEVQVTSLTIKVLKDKSANAMIMHPSIVKKGSNVNKIPYPYIESSKTMNEVKFVVDSSRSITADGQAKNNPALFTIANQNSNIILDQGIYIFSAGTKKVNHWDVYFSGRYHNKMFMQNDDCDGYIWEKYHEPNDYIMCFQEWYSSYYWHNYSFLLYPNDKYVLPNAFPGTSTTNRGGMSKNYVIRGYWYSFYDIGGSWYVSRDGKDWVKNKQDLRPDSATMYGNWSRDDDTCIIVSHGVIYTGEIQDNGQIKFEKVGTTSGWDIYGYGGGYLFLTKQTDHGDVKQVWGMDSHGSLYTTCLNTSPDTSSSISAIAGTLLLIGSYHRTPNIRFIGYSTDGFASVSTITSLDVLPNYGDNFGVSYFGDQFFCHVRRDGQWDLYAIISGPYTGRIWYSATKNVKVEMVGYQTPDVRNGYYRPYAFDGKKAIVPFNYPSTTGLDGCMYFKDGKPSDPFGWHVGYWDAWNDCIMCNVIGECDPHRDTIDSYDLPQIVLQDDGNSSYGFDPVRNGFLDSNIERLWNLSW